MNKLTDRAKSRKFISFAFVIVVSTICLFMSMAEFEQWKDVIIWSMGFYFSANSIGRVANQFTGGNNNPPIKQTDER